MSGLLYSHNRTAYEAASAMLSETGKAAVIHPTGTGKSFIGFQFCLDHPEMPICWLSPSEYIFRTQLENLRAAAEGITPANITFLTYAKLARMDEEEMAALRPGMIIFDEYHRAGAESWGTGVERLLKANPGVPMLGLSATNIRYLDRQRDMAEELFDGNIASEMTLGEAIARGILAAPKYVTAMYSCGKELEKYERRVSHAPNRAVRDAADRYLQALRRALEKADGLDALFDRHMTDRHGKYIVFTPNIRILRECMEKVPEWFGRVDDSPRVYYVYTQEPQAEKSFQDFRKDDKEDHLRLLFAIDALNEGIHAGDISGVILFRPTVSPIVYKQQIGRALSAGSKKEPVIFDIVNNFENLYSIGMIEEEIKAAITYYSYFGEGEEIVCERFQVLDELRDCRRLFEKLEETLGASWDLMYGFAEVYFREYGNIDIPKDYRTSGGHALGRWIFTQRGIRSGSIPGHLDGERIARLDKLGMRWDSARDVSWNRHYRACVQYRESRGDLLVPADYVTKDGIALGRWISSMRQCRKSGIRAGYFTPERERQLDELGMVWSQPDHIWERNYEAARRFYEQNGHLRVPEGYVQDGVKLGLWIRELKKAYRGSAKGQALTPEQVESLNRIGIRWERETDRAWNEGIREAKEYVKEHGVLDAPYSYVAPSGFKLGRWHSKCRENYAKGRLSAERAEELEKLGIVWDRSRKNDWDECFDYAEDYYREHGDLKMPQDFKAGGIWLSRWIHEQRSILAGKREGKRLSSEQIRKLASISVTGESTSDQTWNRYYRDLKELFERTGRSTVPADYMASNGRSLKSWLNTQRSLYRHNGLDERRKSLLEELGAVNAKKQEPGGRKEMRPQASRGPAQAGRHAAGTSASV